MRCNVGIDPRYLPDQHLCELSELKMVPGTLLRIDFKPKTPPPSHFRLGKGHISFFYDKLIYLQRRSDAVYSECLKRNRKGDPDLLASYKCVEFPSWCVEDWSPTYNDTMIVRERVVSRIKEKGSWYRYHGKPIKDIENFCSTLLDSPLYTV